ncbi:MAG: hypothetical protein JSU86_03145 [Phycisphaerales bacterium]|nr:MAG: hypothetical protein JSU86_03145 [Phycisphaerales bacterium]
MLDSVYWTPFIERSGRGDPMSQAVYMIQPTVGEIARRTGYAVHRVEYVIRSRNIRASSRAGNARVFTEADVEQIASELRRIDAEKATTGPGRQTYQWIQEAR